MSKRTLISLAFVLVVSLLLTGLVVAGPAPKVNVCHLDEYGVYHLINISENAFPAHIDHGDAGPGEPVPGVPGKEFDADCNVVDSNVNVAGTWRGESGISGTMGYWFNMTLFQDAAGNVTGTVNYDIGNVRSVTGSVLGNEFTFTTAEASYWADCTPCTVNVDGTYFHGYGTSSSNQNIEWEASKP